MNLSFGSLLRDPSKPFKFFFRLDIAGKILLGYMTLVVFTILVASYALLSFQRLNRLNTNIMHVDVPVQEAAGGMLEALIAQDAYEKRSLILSRKDIRGLFWKRGEEFDSWLSALKELPENSAFPLKTVEKLHRQYHDLFVKETKLKKMGNAAEATALSNGDVRKVWEKLFRTLKSLPAEAKASQERAMGEISRIGRSAFSATALLYGFSIILGAAVGIAVTRHISSSLHKLRAATGHIARGDFDYDPEIRTEDEIGGLSRAFLAMGKRLRELEGMYLDASPLTRLPGGIAIENVLKKRLVSGRKIAFCIVDLDNFKAFNDRYGYAHGNEVIKETARIIDSAVREKGLPDDFVGHVGGDDYVVITTPDRMRDIGDEIISQFDRGIPRYYDQRDRANGYIFGKNRQGVQMRFPIMTISIAIVTNEWRKFIDPLEVSEIAADLKEYAKTITKSFYVIDKRRTA